MEITTNLIIANCISFAAAVFTAGSCWAKREDVIYYLQVGQCLLLCIASFFFGSYAGIATLALCCIRNFILAKGIYNKSICMLLAAGMLIFGVIFNNMGAVGWIVIAANVIYTLGAYFAQNELLIKINIIIDLVLWMIYEVIIIDIPSLISDAIGTAIAIGAIARYLRNAKISHSEESGLG